MSLYKSLYKRIPVLKVCVTSSAISEIVHTGHVEMVNISLLGYDESKLTHKPKPLQEPKLKPKPKPIFHPGLKSNV